MTIVRADRQSLYAQMERSAKRHKTITQSLAGIFFAMAAAYGAQGIYNAATPAPTPEQQEQKMPLPLSALFTGMFGLMGASNLRGAKRNYESELRLIESRKKLDESLDKLLAELREEKAAPQGPRPS
jgi:hypothetical protein